MVPKRAAARAVPISPSGWYMRCWPVGASRTGLATGTPSTVVAWSRVLTSTRTRGRSRTSSNARRLAATVASLSAPLSM